jgi:23S rRNA (adenine2503-C2)-methyltransferase
MRQRHALGAAGGAAGVEQPGRVILRARRDGSARLLVALHDGQTVEAVLLPRDGPVRQHAGRLCRRLHLLHDRPGRPAAPAGQRRDRGPGGLARTDAPVKKVVFMGMGEPAHNLDAVLEAIELLGTRRHRPQEPGVLHRGRPAAVRAPAAAAA